MQQQSVDGADAAPGGPPSMPSNDAQAAHGGEAPMLAATQPAAVSEVAAQEAQVEDLGEHLWTEPMWGHLGGPPVPLGALVRGLVNDLHEKFAEIGENNENNKVLLERRKNLFAFVDATRQRLMRLYALTKWSRHWKHKLKTLAELLGFVDHRDNVLVDAVSSLTNVSRSLEASMYPIWDVSSALNVLETGSYGLLPHVIRENVAWKKGVSPELRARTLERLDTMLRVRLMQTAVPPRVHNLRVGGGVARFSVHNEFEASVSLRMIPGAPEDEDARIKWVLFDLHVLIDVDQRPYAPIKQQRDVVAEYSRFATASASAKRIGGGEDDAMSDVSESDEKKASTAAASPSADHAVGVVAESASKLLPPHHVSLIKDMVNEKLLGSPKEPLGVMYDTLHMFCLNLQFSVLKSQIDMLRSEFGADVRVDHSEPDVLEVSLWPSAPDVPQVPEKSRFFLPSASLSAQEKREQRSASRSASRARFGSHEQHTRRRRSRDPARTEKANMRIYVKNEQLSVRFSPRIPALATLQGKHPFTIDPSRLSLTGLVQRAAVAYSNYRLLQFVQYIRHEQSFQPLATHAYDALALIDCDTDGNKEVGAKFLAAEGEAAAPEEDEKSGGAMVDEGDDEAGGTAQEDPTCEIVLHPRPLRLLVKTFGTSSVFITPSVKTGRFAFEAVPSRGASASAVAAMRDPRFVNRLQYTSKTLNESPEDVLKRLYVYRMHAMVGYFKYLASKTFDSSPASSSDEKQPDGVERSNSSTPADRLVPLAASRRPAVVWPPRGAQRAIAAAAGVGRGGRSPGSSSDDEKAPKPPQSSIDPSISTPPLPQRSIYIRLPSFSDFYLLIEYTANFSPQFSLVQTRRGAYALTDRGRPIAAKATGGTASGGGQRGRGRQQSLRGGGGASNSRRRLDRREVGGRQVVYKRTDIGVSVACDNDETWSARLMRFTPRTLREVVAKAERYAARELFARLLTEEGIDFQCSSNGNNEQATSASHDANGGSATAASENGGEGDHDVFTFDMDCSIKSVKVRLVVERTSHKSAPHSSSESSPSTSSASPRSPSHDASHSPPSYARCKWTAHISEPLLHGARAFLRAQHVPVVPKVMSRKEVNPQRIRSGARSSTAAAAAAGESKDDGALREDGGGEEMYKIWPDNKSGVVFSFSSANAFSIRQLRLDATSLLHICNFAVRLYHHNHSSKDDSSAGGAVLPRNFFAKASLSPRDMVLAVNEALPPSNGVEKPSRPSDTSNTMKIATFATVSQKSEKTQVAFQLQLSSHKFAQHWHFENAIGHGDSLIKVLQEMYVCWEASKAVNRFMETARKFDARLNIEPSVALHALGAKTLRLRFRSLNSSVELTFVDPKTAQFLLRLPNRTSRAVTVEASNLYDRLMQWYNQCGVTELTKHFRKAYRDPKLAAKKNGGGGVALIQEKYMIGLSKDPRGILGASQWHVLATYLAERICARPFYGPSLSAFAALLHAPQVVLTAMLPVLRLDLASDAPNAEKGGAQQSNGEKGAGNTGAKKEAPHTKFRACFHWVGEHRFDTELDYVFFGAEFYASRHDGDDTPHPSDDRVFLPLAYDLQCRCLTLFAVASRAPTSDGRDVKRVKALCVGGTKKMLFRPRSPVLDALEGELPPLKAGTPVKDVEEAKAAGERLVALLVALARRPLADLRRLAATPFYAFLARAPRTEESEARAREVQRVGGRALRESTMAQSHSEDAARLAAAKSPLMRPRPSTAVIGRSPPIGAARTPVRGRVAPMMRRASTPITAALTRHAPSPMRVSPTMSGRPGAGRRPHPMPAHRRSPATPMRRGGPLTAKIAALTRQQAAPAPFAGRRSPGMHPRGGELRSPGMHPRAGELRSPGMHGRAAPLRGGVAPRMAAPAPTARHASIGRRGGAPLRVGRISAPPGGGGVGRGGGGNVASQRRLPPQSPAGAAALLASLAAKTAPHSASGAPGPSRASTTPLHRGQAQRSRPLSSAATAPMSSSSSALASSGRPQGFKPTHASAAGGARGGGSGGARGGRALRPIQGSTRPPRSGSSTAPTLPVPLPFSMGGGPVPAGSAGALNIQPLPATPTTAATSLPLLGTATQLSTLPALPSLAAFGTIGATAAPMGTSTSASSTRRAPSSSAFQQLPPTTASSAPALRSPLPSPVASPGPSPMASPLLNYGGANPLPLPGTAPAATSMPAAPRRPILVGGTRPPVGARRAPPPPPR